MSWIKSLCDMYDANQEYAGEYPEGEREPLIPVAHLSVDATMEITIDQNANLIHAEYIKKEKTITPCTEDSSSRTSSAAKSPHILSDKLFYFAGDIEYYTNSKIIGFESLVKLLDQWNQSEYSDEQIIIFTKYLMKASLIHDLAKSGLLTIKDNELLPIDYEQNPLAPKGKAPLEIVVRWKVYFENREDRLWVNKSIMKKWQDYYVSTCLEKGFCQVYGDTRAITRLHPKNIYNLAANAKLLSGNDNDGYTFRGRFTESNQVFQISYEASQKAHNVLRWLIEKQGKKSDKKVFLTWVTDNSDIVQPLEDDYGFSNHSKSEYTGEDAAEYFRFLLSGMKKKGNFNMNRVMILNMESATDGRMSITYYQEFQEETYLKMLLNWHETCRWIIPYYDQNNKTWHKFIGAPAPRDIINLLYKKDGGIDSQLYGVTLDRLIACIVDGNKIPQDMVSLATHRVSNRMHYGEDETEFLRDLAVACALYKKYSMDYRKEKYEMALDKNRSTRDYLYGRLLALAQNIEQWAKKEDKNDSSVTNADRYMQRFAQRPYSTWQVIEGSLNPYIAKIGHKSFKKMKLMDEIMSMFKPEDYMDDHALSGEFLLGYHCQRYDFFNQTEEENKEDI